MSAPWLSIIIPVYNMQDCLPRCLRALAAEARSLRGQSSVPELLLIDDGSTDGSGAVADAYARRFPFLRVVHQENGGVARARNRGLAEARGAWVWFIDPDDTVLRGSFDRVRKMTGQAGEADILMADALWHGRRRRRDCHHFPKDTVFCGRERLLALQRGMLYPRAYDRAVSLPRAHDRAAGLRQTTGLRQAANLLKAASLPRTVNLPFAAPWDKLYRRAFLERHRLRFPEGLAVLDDMTFNVQAFGRARQVRYFHTFLYCYENVADSVTNRCRPDRIAQDCKVWKALEAIERAQRQAGALNGTEAALLRQARYARILRSFAIALRLQLFHPGSGLTWRQQCRAVRETLAMPVYREALWGAPLSLLEGRLKLLALAARLDAVWLLYAMYVGQRTGEKLWRAIAGRSCL